MTFVGPASSGLRLISRSPSRPRHAWPRPERQPTYEQHDLSTSSFTGSDDPSGDLVATFPTVSNGETGPVSRSRGPACAPSTLPLLTRSGRPPTPGSA